MKIERLVLGSLETNCYILSIGNNVLVIDPADEYEKIKKVVGSRNILGSVVTHHHFDHVGALNYFDKVYDFNNLKEGNNNIDGFNFEVIYTLGHTDDSITLYFKKNNVMFVGDFLFKNGIGRTDLGGDIIDMKNSIKKISNYNKEITIYPGHGEPTRLGIELKNLSYLGY